MAQVQRGVVQRGVANRGLACGVAGGAVIAELLLIVFSVAGGYWPMLIPASVLGAPTGAFCGGLVSLAVLGILRLLPAVTARPWLAQLVAGALAGAVPLAVMFGQGWPSNGAGLATGLGLAAASLLAAVLCIPRILYGRRELEAAPPGPGADVEAMPAAPPQPPPAVRRSAASMVQAGCGWGPAAGSVCGVLVLAVVDPLWLIVGLPFAVTIGAFCGLIEAVLVGLGLALFGRPEHLTRTRVFAATLAVLPWLVPVLLASSHSATFWRFEAAAALGAGLAAALLTPRVLQEPRADLVT